MLIFYFVTVLQINSRNAPYVDRGSIGNFEVTPALSSPRSKELIENAFVNCIGTEINTVVVEVC